MTINKLEKVIKIFDKVPIKCPMSFWIELGK